MGLKLKDFQKENVEFALAMGRPIRMLNCDEPGLGKTYSTLETLWQAQLRGPTLISTLKIAIDTWVRHIEQVFPRRPIYVHEGTPKKRQAAQVRFMVDQPSEPFVICNHHMTEEASRYLDNWETLVVDEAHHGRNHKTQLHNTLRGIKYENLFLLTGTPESNGPVDMYGYLSLIDPNEFSSFWDWVDVHCKRFKDQYGYHIGGPKNPKLTRSVLKKYMVRHTKDQVAPELTKTREPIWVDLTRTQQKYYDGLVEDFFVENEITDVDQEEKFVLIENDPVLSLRLRQLCVTPALLGLDGPSASLEALKEFGGNLKKPLVIFTQFRQAIPHIAQALPKRMEKFTIHGGMKKEKLDSTIQRFETSDKPWRTLIATCDLSAGYSINSATYALVIGPSWSHTVMEQAEERLSRLGNSNHLTVYYILSRNTVERDVIDRLAMKKEWANQTIEFHRHEDKELVHD